MSDNRQLLSVVLPVHNLAATVGDNLGKAATFFETLTRPIELVPVDDGSSDTTKDEIAKFVSSFSGVNVSIRPVYLTENGGKGAALKAGFYASRGELVMLLDGDLDISPRQTPRFLDEMARTNADVVIGSKRHRESVVKYPWHRRLVSWCYFTLVRLFISLPITDTQTGMKLFRREVLADALGRMLVKTYAFDLELLSIVHSRGAKIVEAPVVIDFGEKFGCLKPRTVRTMAWDSLAVFYRLKMLKYYNHVIVPPMSKSCPLVSIVIACPNRSWMLEECLEAISRQTYRNFEIIVLDDDKTGKVRPAEKRNAGIKEARGEIIAFIDDDAYPESHWLEYAIKYFAEPTIGALGGPAITPPNDGFLAKCGGRVYDNIFVSGNYRYRYKAGGICRTIDDYPSCNLFVRKSILERIGGYRTDFWPGEDTLLCKDIVDSGAKIVYDPWVTVYHHRRALFAPHLRQLGRYAFHRGYFVKRFPSNSLRLSYFIPSAFVLAMPFGYWLWPLYGFYFVLIILSTFSFNPVKWFITALGVFLSHVIYGVRFMQGLLAKRAPCEFIGKDHV